jgi:hypothetical protein
MLFTMIRCKSKIHYVVVSYILSVFVIKKIWLMIFRGTSCLEEWVQLFMDPF